METRPKYINQSSFYGSDYFLTRIGYEEKWNRVKRLGDTYYENELLERSVTEKYGSNLKIGKVDNTAAAIGATGSGKLSIDEYVGDNLENVDKLKTVGGSVGISTSGINSIGINYNDRKQEGITKNTVIGNVEIGKSSGDEINKDLGSMTEITKDRDFKTDINIESQTINYAKNPEAFKQDLKKAKNEIEDIGNVVKNTINPKGEDKRNIFENLRAQRWNTSFYNVTGSRMEELSEKFKTGEINEKQFKEAVRELAKGYGKDIGIDFEVVYLDEKTMPKDSEGSTGSAYIVDKENKRVLIPIDIEKIKKTGDLFGTITEEISHGKDALEGRQDKKVAEDETNKEKGLESLGRPANDYVKNKLGEDNNSKIKLSTDGIDLSNADVGEKVGDHLPMNDVKAAGGYEVVFKVDPSNDPLSIKARAWSEKYLTQERVDQIVNGVLNSATGTYIFIAGGTILVAVLTGGSGVIAIGPYLVSSGVAAVGGVAATTVGLARLKYGNDQLKNGLFDEKIVQPKHIIADSPFFRNNKEDYYLLESMIGIGAIQAAPHTFPIGTVENTPLQQGVLPYYSNTYTNSPAVTNVGNTSLTLYNNQNGLFAPVGANVIPAMTPLLITDGANKVNQVQNNSLPYNSKLALPVKYPIVTKSGVTLYKGYAMGPRGAKYTEVGVSNNKEIVYKNSNGSYFKLTDKGLENISSKDVIKKEYFPTVKVQKNNGSNPSAGKDYYVSKEGNFKVEKYIEAGQTVEDYDKKYLVENARARGINVGRSKEHTNTTLGHWEKAVDIADEASKDPNVKAVYVDEALRNISDKFKDDKTIPDVTIEYEDGTFKLIEVQSKTDRFYDLQDKLQNLQTKYGKDVIKNYKVEKPKGGK